MCAKEWELQTQTEIKSCYIQMNLGIKYCGLPSWCNSYNNKKSINIHTVWKVQFFVHNQVVTITTISIKKKHCFAEFRSFYRGTKLTGMLTVLGSRLFIFRTVTLSSVGLKQWLQLYCHLAFFVLMVINTILGGQRPDPSSLSLKTISPLLEHKATDTSHHWFTGLL